MEEQELKAKLLDSLVVILNQILDFQLYTVERNQFLQIQQFPT